MPIPPATCRSDHQLTPDNLYIYSDRWYCKTCHRRNQRNAKRRARERREAKGLETRRRRLDRDSLVYFISDGLGHVKIGIALDPAERLRQLQGANPCELVLEAVLPGGREVEMQLHDLFSNYCVRGEWFVLSEQIGVYIDGVLTSPSV